MNRSPPPTYPALLKAFRLVVLEKNPTKEEEDHIHDTINRLKESENWPGDESFSSNESTARILI